MSSANFPNFFAPWLPQSVDERFNNGWTFGNVIVTTANSRAPDVEREVVSKHSYGRQIGRLTDAVVALAKRAGMADDPQVKPLIELAQKVEAIKEEACKRRRESLLDELRALKRDDPKAWAALVKAADR